MFPISGGMYSLIFLCTRKQAFFLLKYTAPADGLLGFTTYVMFSLLQRVLEMGRILNLI